MSVLKNRLIRVLIVCYAAYAVSPVYSSMSIVNNGTHPTPSAQTTSELPFGIVMINVLLSHLLDIGPADTSDDNNIDFLIMKKRALACKEFRVAPCVETALLPPEDLAPVVSNHFRYEILDHRRHQAPDSYYALDSGLSPPVFLS